MEDINRIAVRYSKFLKDFVTIPSIPDGTISSWAQYSILLKDEEQRDNVKSELCRRGIPCFIYYRKPMHTQVAFQGIDCVKCDLSVTESVCCRVPSLPIHPYMCEEEQDEVVKGVREGV